jgi:dipeptidyl aminopeptidase/acylaminoacyl peptidase
VVSQRQVLVPTVQPTWSDVPGVVEYACWSPDGSRLALLVAAHGAQVSDVHGSGTNEAAQGDETWRPRVLPAEGGRRSLVVWSPKQRSTQTVSELNIWEACWCGPDTLIALTSADAGEGAWYGAGLTYLPLEGDAKPWHVGRHQLAQPSSAPDGRHWSVLAGAASDRGLLAGSLLVARHGDEAVDCDTQSTHVTDHQWIDDDRVLFTGMRGLDTVIGVVDIKRSETAVLWEGSATSGVHQPQLSGVSAGGQPLFVMEQHHTPPVLGRITDGGFKPVVDTAGPGSESVAKLTGSTSVVSWTSSDGTEVQGLLTMPDAPGPHALVVNVHGGPIAAWHDGWIARDVYTTLLAARGYAVLRPNPRGSTGRGAEYAEAILGDIGGKDVDDVTSGVDHLVDGGLVDPRRVGITGNSYGGYMSAWLPCLTDRFAASVSRSPVTDWRSQHLTSNIAEFDRIFVTGDPFDPESQYQTRSPLGLHQKVATPILFTAGAKDLATPPSQAEQMYMALRERGVDSQLVIYPEEGHGVRAPSAQMDQCARMLAWFERFMPPEPVSRTLDA